MLIVLPSRTAPARPAVSAAFPPSWYAASLPEPPALPRCRMNAGRRCGARCRLYRPDRSPGTGYARPARGGAGRAADRLGASGRNGGQALVGYGCEVDELERQLGRDDARHLFDWSRDAVQAMRARIDRHGIDCHWVEGHASVAIRERHERDLQANCGICNATTTPCSGGTMMPCAHSWTAHAPRRDVRSAQRASAAPGLLADAARAAGA